MSKKIERYEGRSAEDLNEKNCCAFCGGVMGREVGNSYDRIYTNTAGLWFDRQSCRTKHNSEIEQAFEIDSGAIKFLEYLETL